MQRVQEKLREALEEDILTGALVPGQRIDERELAARFATSRTPVREALLQLAASGLILQRPRRGTFVAEVGPTRLVEMFEVMAELEGLCARLAARRASSAALVELRDLHQSCRAARQAGDADAYYYANEEFHEAIRALAGNAFLQEQADALQRRLRPYRRLQLRAVNRIRSSFDEHERVLEAISAGRERDADESMRAHVAVQSDRFADLIAGLDTDRSQRRATR